VNNEVAIEAVNVAFAVDDPVNDHVDDEAVLTRRAPRLLHVAPAGKAGDLELS
jgi:hypothetical protein